MLSCCSPCVADTLISVAVLTTSKQIGEVLLIGSDPAASVNSSVAEVAVVTFQRLSRDIDIK